MVRSPAESHTRLFDRSPLSRKSEVGPQRTGDERCAKFLTTLVTCKAMARKPYRVELYFPSSGQPKYYLVKDVAVDGKRRKVRKYLGVTQPTADDIARYRAKYGSWLESRAISAKARITAAKYKSRYLGGLVHGLELVRHLNDSVMRHLTLNEVEAYEKEFEISYVQGTTSIEGNTLTRRQAGDLLAEGIAPRSKSLREINEVQNFRRVIQHRRSYRGKVTTDFIQTLHSMIMANIDLESAGQFRRVDDIAITGCDLKVTPAALVREELEAAIRGYYGGIRRGYHPFEEAVLFHYRLEMIHPFTDGNGRVGREVLNFMLMKSDFPRLLFLGRDREKYLSALRDGNQSKFGSLALTFAELLVDQRQRILEERLLSVAVPRRKTGQLRLSDFVSVG
jgi:Fic family protein